MERAFTCFQATGMFANPKQFLHENYWKPHEGFVEVLCEISEGHWEVILSQVMSPAGNDDDEDIDSSSDSSAAPIQQNKLFIPPTPVKR